MRWVQTKRHVYVLGPLLRNDSVVEMSRQVDDHLLDLQLELKRVERHFKDLVSRRDGEDYVMISH